MNSGFGVRYVFGDRICSVNFDEMWRGFGGDFQVAPHSHNVVLRLLTGIVIIPHIGGTETGPLHQSWRHQTALVIENGERDGLFVVLRLYHVIR